MIQGPDIVRGLFYNVDPQAVVTGQRGDGSYITTIKPFQIITTAGIFAAYSSIPMLGVTLATLATTISGWWGASKVANQIMTTIDDFEDKIDQKIAEVTGVPRLTFLRALSVASMTTCVAYLLGSSTLKAMLVGAGASVAMSIIFGNSSRSLLDFGDDDSSM